MIDVIRHKGLRRLYERDDARGLYGEHVAKIRIILLALDAATTIDGIDLPSFRLHRLTRDLDGFWAVTVRANWRIIFRFEHGTATDIDLVDYH